MIDWVIFMKKAREISAAVLLVSAAAMCIFAADTVGGAVYAALQRCLTAVIPSLFAMIAISGLLIRSGTVTAAGRLVHRAGRLLLGMDGDILLIFLFSNIAGYPVGARMLLSCYEAGRLTRREAELLAGVCFGAGPAFIYGCIAGQLYRSARVGILISLSTAIGSLVCAGVLSLYLRRHGHGAPPRTGVALRAEMLPECISSAGRAMTEICAAILGFAVISAILVRAGVIPAAAELLSRLTGRDFPTSAGLICSALDVTAVHVHAARRHIPREAVADARRRYTPRSSRRELCRVQTHAADVHRRGGGLRRRDDAGVQRSVACAVGDTGGDDSGGAGGA